MPVLTLDLAMVLVERALRIAGVSGGATRDEIRAAMDDLVYSADAIALPDRGGIIVRIPDSSTHAITTGAVSPAP
jgi:hypothetical protein